jgi:hypothetical protein
LLLNEIWLQPSIEGSIISETIARVAGTAISTVDLALKVIVHPLKLAISFARFGSLHIVRRI